jgi:hypothetical protein
MRGSKAREGKMSRSMVLALAITESTAKSFREYGSSTIDRSAWNETLDSIRCQDLVLDNPRVWSRMPFPNRPYDYRGQPVDEMIHHYEFDCSGEERRRLEGTYFFRGAEVKEFGKGRWKDADRSSPMWLLMKAACN